MHSVEDDSFDVPPPKRQKVSGADDDLATSDLLPLASSSKIFRPFRVCIITVGKTLANLVDISD